MIFEDAVSIILQKEGGYVFDPKDFGGETKFGISKRQYPSIDIELLSVGHAKMIYERDYWNGIQAMSLPEGLRLMVFDSAVNQGVFSSIIILQKMVGAKKDGLIGPKSLEAVEKYKNKNGVAIMNIEYAKLRVIRYMRTKTFEHFGAGWINRVFEVLRASEEALHF